jgi:hypothetical protein
MRRQPFRGLCFQQFIEIYHFISERVYSSSLLGLTGNVVGVMRAQGGRVCLRICICQDMKSTAAWPLNLYDAKKRTRISP